MEEEELKIDWNIDFSVLYLRTESDFEFVETHFDDESSVAQYPVMLLGIVGELRA